MLLHMEQLEHCNIIDKGKCFLVEQMLLHMEQLEHCNIIDKGKCFQASRKSLASINQTLPYLGALQAQIIWVTNV